MPHYVLQLNKPRGKFAVYSTVVDNLITDPMSGPEMRTWLEEREYDTWLKQGWDSLEELVAKYGEETGKAIREYQQRTNQWMYWNEKSRFMYAKEADEFFCLPRALWRWE